MRTTCTLNLRKVDPDLVYRLKVLAMERRLTLHDLCIELLSSGYLKLRETDERVEV